MEPKPRDHFDAATRNLTIAQDLLHHRPGGLDQPAFEWVVIVSFYSAVRSINALILRRSGMLPRSHGERLRFIVDDDDLRAINEEYRDLRDWSEQARYTVSSSAFDGYRAQIAVDSAAMIRDHVHTAIEPD